MGKVKVIYKKGKSKIYTFYTGCGMEGYFLRIDDMRINKDLIKEWKWID